MELISGVLRITLHHWPARGVNYSRAELHYISRPVGELINNSITSPLAPFCFDSTRQKSCFDCKRQKSCFDSKRQKSCFDSKRQKSSIFDKKSKKMRKGRFPPYGSI